MKKRLFLVHAMFSAAPILIPALIALSVPRTPAKSAAGREPAVSVSAKSEDRISVLDSKSGLLSNVGIEEYLVGVLAGEMPAEYELEALKAQAVAARTYIMYKSLSVSEEHPDAVVCSNPAHCKAWLSVEECADKWSGANAELYAEKLRRAVSETSGEYMTYDGAPIEAVFFAVCGGRTEASEDVWGGKRPYLRSVESEGDLSCENLCSEVRVSTESFRDIIMNANPKAEIDISAPSFSEISRTDGGSTAELTIGGQSFSGTELRAMFGLKSANFTLSQDGGEMVFSVKGNGHGVGMSQYGANFMARHGTKYTEILSHYYSNIQIVKK